jgi:hypothetical protein
VACRAACLALYLRLRLLDEADDYSLSRLPDMCNLCYSPRA